MSHDFPYPSRDEDTCIHHRRYDAKEWLIAWSVRHDERFLLFRGSAFREMTLENGEKLDVPERIECRFLQIGIDPECALADGSTWEENSDSAASPDHGAYEWPSREYDPETTLQYNQARHYNPTVGRWLGDVPLKYEASEDNLYRYANADQDAGEK